MGINNTKDEEKLPASTFMSQSGEDIRFSILKNESDDNNGIADDCQLNNPPNTQMLSSSPFPHRGVSEISEYCNQGRVPSTSLMTDTMEANFTHYADDQILVYAPYSNFLRPEEYTDEASYYAAHGFSAHSASHVSNSHQKLQHSGDTGTSSSRDISVGSAQRINPNADKKMVSNTNISLADMTYDTERVSLPQNFEYHHNQMGRSFVNPYVDMIAPHASPQNKTGPVSNSARNLVSGICRDNDLGIMSAIDPGTMLAPSYALQRRSASDALRCFRLIDGNLEHGIRGNIFGEFSTPDLLHEFQGNPTSSVSFEANPDGFDKLGQNLSDGQPSQSSSLRETTDQCLTWQMEDLDMNFSRNKLPHLSMNPVSVKNTEQRITTFNHSDNGDQAQYNDSVLPLKNYARLSSKTGQESQPSEESNRRAEQPFLTWRKRNPTQPSMSIPHPQRQKTQTAQPCIPPTFSTSGNVAPSLPNLVKNVPPLQTLPSPMPQVRPALSLPCGGKTSSSCSQWSQPPSSSQSPSAAQFPPPPSQVPLPSFIPQASTAFPLLPQVKGIPPLPGRPVASSKASTLPQACAAPSQQSKDKGDSVNPSTRDHSSMRPPLKKAPTLSPLTERPQVSHIECQVSDETGEELGHKCLLCKRDLAYNPEGAIFVPATSPNTAVLPCGHTFHDECLMRITPDNEATNPPCIPCAVGDF